MSGLELISDLSDKKLVTLPKNVLDMVNLKMLVLEGNFLTRLPEDLFWRLPNLQWLDLRNNLLEAIPTSIGFHEKLENLLLTNNSLERLPNELGTVPNLKSLQVTENPLIYPERKVIMCGTKAIKSYLKTQYDLANRESKEEEDISDKITELDEHSLQDDYFDEVRKSKTEPNIISDEEAKIKKLKNRISDDQCINPDLEVRKLLPPILRKKDAQEPMKIIHKVTSDDNRISLKSFYTKPTPKNQKMHEKKYQNLKDGWLNELRILLTDQERILQQERNLRSISNWRLRRKMEPYREMPVEKTKPPFDTDPQYEKMMTREELAKTLNEFKQKGFIKPGEPNSTTPVQLQTMIKHIMDQLKEFELESDLGSNSIEMDRAEKQIRTMMDIQKKLMSLKSLNDVTL
ncbi:unnamed protein product [Phyllotreta striolata]|uniref:Uncharacterized protein n=1 Tax=Phyllotreta striolata TaxID=444603 RepID=A0A9N9TT50_PHYSR|nr:unnamed protein product [Phyllotreta striolata]